MITKKDDRTGAQKLTHRTLVTARDAFMSGWGGAGGGVSVCAWACLPEDVPAVFDWVCGRPEMRRVGVTSSERYRPRGGCSHFHIYAVGPDHPALKGARR